VIAVIVVVAIIIFAAVGVFLFYGGPGEDNSQNTQPGTNVLTTGAFTTSVSSQVGPSGGNVAVSGASDPLKGFSLEIPSGAVKEKISYSVKHADINTAEGLPDGAKVVSKMIQVEASGSSIWNQFKVLDTPALVTMPYDQSKVTNEDGIRFYRYDASTNSLSATGFIGQDKNANTITFAISTFSNFTAIEVIMDYFEGNNASIGYDTGFRPKNDGFFIPNQGSYQTSGGNCLGMVAFAKWYHRWEKPSTGADLFGKYREGDNAEWRDDATAIQLASRASLSATWNLNIPEMSMINSASRLAGVSLIHGMVVSGEPQIIGLYTQYVNGSFNQGSHAILAYKYSNGAFDTYDPNDPGTASGTAKKLIPFTYAGGFTQIYKSGLTSSSPLQFNWFFHAGDQVFTPNAAFKGLYDSAERKFTDDSTFPKVTLTDQDSTPVGSTPIDTDSDDVRDTTENKITISGTITGGLKPVNSTLIFVSNQKFETPVDSTGAFSQIVPLYTGVNVIIILATATNTLSNWAGFLRDKVDCTATPAALTVTMSWGQGSSDVDLHVLEPTILGAEGRHIYYSNEGSAYDNHPYLDFDNTNGYGPEHYYAKENMTLPNQAGEQPLYGDYSIRVHYYTDHDSDVDNIQPITWTVHVRYLAFKDVRSGLEIWEEESFSGYLGTANSGSAHTFSASDSSWSEVYTVSYNEPNPEDYAIPDPPATIFAP